MDYEIVDIINISDTRESAGDVFIISNEAILIYTWVVYSVVCQLLNIFGIVTNVINIICFVKQGFKDSVNITLLGLSISDLGSLVTLSGTCLSITPAFVAADLPFDTVEVTYLTTVMPHLSFTRVSSCITALITLERCLCIIAPLKIKSIITPNRAAVVTACVFITFLSTATPVYAVNRLDMKFSPVKNKTTFGLVFMKDKENVEKISFTINNFAIPFGTFFIVVICTTVLSLQLLKATKWRKMATSFEKVDRVAFRNQKVAKMVVMISALFIACFVPMSVIMLALGFIPELSFEGKYINVSILIFGIGYILEGINTSMNIFIYYHMSSKYREQFCRLFRRKKIIQQKNL